MSKFNKCIGFYGEDLASSYLKSKGYYILDKNFKNKYGEIDLICRHDGLIIFVEVKSRYNYNYGLPCEAVTYSKQRQIINLCKFYLLTRKLFDYNCRLMLLKFTLIKIMNLIYYNTPKMLFEAINKIIIYGSASKLILILTNNEILIYVIFHRRNFIKALKYLFLCIYK